MDARLRGCRQIWNGDAVEFYLDTRRGEKLGAKEFAPGSLHCFYTPFTKTEIKPRIQVRDLPAFKDFKLIEVESFDAWRNRLQSHGVIIEKEMEWSRGGRSLYFRDPAGNSVELVTPGLWGLPSGW